jgi:hypothetical protein
VQLHPQPAGATVAAKLTGSVTSQNGATPPVATSIDVQVSALETVSGGLTVTVPQLPNIGSAVLALMTMTQSSSSCATATYCVSYTIPLPAAAPYVGAFAAGGTTLTLRALPAAYTIDGLAFVPSSGGTTDCSPGDAGNTGRWVNSASVDAGFHGVSIVPSTAQKGHLRAGWPFVFVKMNNG